ncbi:sorting nexin-24 isoform X2 [Nannospalax galili]|uniref:sorting nexin-24 isoform X2 n=1 Tax=Nannospalax galili TaxID=1026970 RepID=UPI0004ED39D6|nr:sorting nexin-24 isoform X2 [Nannospalax galili]
MEVYIPSFRHEESDLERGYTVFKIEVLMNGRKHFVEKRYSEFHALHKKLKKCIKTPEIPSKHVRNWVPKVLEQRRQGLETYLQAVILENEELPKLFLDFLNVRHLPSLPKAESCGSFDETESEESSKLSHQPVLLFLGDPYVLPAASAYFELEEEEIFQTWLLKEFFMAYFTLISNLGRNPPWLKKAEASFKVVGKEINNYQINQNSGPQQL